MPGEVVPYDPDEALLQVIQIEEQLSYGHARLSVLHRMKARALRDVLYGE